MALRSQMMSMAKKKFHRIMPQNMSSLPGAQGISEGGGLPLSLLSLGPRRV